MPLAFLQLLFFGCFLVGLLFLVRLLCAPFSEKVREQMSRRPALHWVWGGVAFFGWYVWFVLLNVSAWPPAWWERRAQRATVVKRVQAAGGWETLRRDCLSFAQTNQIVQWNRWYTNDAPELPPAIAALHPQRVDYVSPKVLGSRSALPIVRVKIFGMHSTGGHSIPYFGLEVISGTSSEGNPRKLLPPTPGNGHLKRRKVCDGVYEVF
jgi:hypothetical protein